MSRWRLAHPSFSKRMALSMKSCDNCEREISDHLSVCPYCDRLQMSGDLRVRQTKRVVVVVILTIILTSGWALIRYYTHGVIPLPK